MLTALLVFAGAVAAAVGAVAAMAAATDGE